MNEKFLTYYAAIDLLTHIQRHVTDSTGQPLTQREADAIAAALIRQLMADRLTLERAQEAIDQMHFGTVKNRFGTVA